MAKQKFKVGDRVRVVNDDWSTFAYVKIGDEGTVRGYLFGIYASVKLDNVPGWPPLSIPQSELELIKEG